jgi:hypothetical protein
MQNMSVASKMLGLAMKEARPWRVKDLSERVRRSHDMRDLTGQISGRLKAIERASNDRHKKAQWLCLCECGNSKVVGRANLVKGIARSCGCLRCEISSARFTTHGHARARTATPTYLSYKAAKSRCENINNKRFADYGGRGIQFRFTSFDQFLAELGERPEGYSLERIDNDGHYEPGNVRWATRQQQCNNKRSNHRVTAAFGRTRTISRWGKETGIKPSIISDRICAGWPPEEALTRPPRRVRINNKLEGAF